MLIFPILVTLALLGDARIFLFVMNRFVFGDHREEKSPWTFLIYALPPVLVALTALFWPLQQWLSWLFTRASVERLTPAAMERAATSPLLASLGAIWLVLAALIGAGWLASRIRALALPKHATPGVRSQPPDVHLLRKAHVPFPWLRRLGAHNEVIDIEVTRHEVYIDGLPREFDGYRIAFLTDTHVATFVRRSFYRECVRQAMLFEPDLVLLGGDFVSFHRHIPLMGEVLLTDLKAPDGVRAVLGNHDYWAGGDEVRATMEARGVEFVINRNVRIRRGTAEIALLGIDEVYRGEPDVDAAFAGIGESTVRLGLTHHPDMIGELRDRRIDLLVAGHTHGGQIRFPFFGAVVVPSRYEGRYAEGFHRVGRVLLYVSRGIGAIPPLRILCRPEVATFTLRCGARS
jgi:uncharacterized protein